jgi:hypothetical protein
MKRFASNDSTDHMCLELVDCIGVVLVLEVQGTQTEVDETRDCFDFVDINRCCFHHLTITQQ